jgi:hypothetical protein
LLIIAASRRFIRGRYRRNPAAPHEFPGIVVKFPRSRRCESIDTPWIAEQLIRACQSLSQLKGLLTLPVNPSPGEALYR